MGPVQGVGFELVLADGVGVEDRVCGVSAAPEGFDFVDEGAATAIDDVEGQVPSADSQSSGPIVSRHEAAANGSSFREDFVDQVGDEAPGLAVVRHVGQHGGWDFDVRVSRRGVEAKGFDRMDRSQVEPDHHSGQGAEVPSDRSLVGPEVCPAVRLPEISVGQVGFVGVTAVAAVRWDGESCLLAGQQVVSRKGEDSLGGDRSGQDGPQEQGG